MITPNVIIYQTRSEPLKNRKAYDVIEIPKQSQGANIDAGIIDQIRNQPKPNDIKKHTISPYDEDIVQMVRLMGAYCLPNSVLKIYRAIEKIHNTFNEKKTPEVKNWIKLLTGLHPDVDKKIKNLGYWKKPYSEVIGTNTIVYYPTIESIDITNWGQKPKFVNNEVKWFLEPWESPSYLRETVRHKLDSSAVEYIQNANLLTTQIQRRNHIYEAFQSTEMGSGTEKTQVRPIEPIVPTINHGVSLNNDWYHQFFRIMPGTAGAKFLSWNNAYNHLTEGGFLVYRLVNHMEPLLNVNTAYPTNSRFVKPLGVEETFPNRKSNLYVDVDNSGQVVLNNTGEINNDVLEPEIIQGE